MDTILKIFPAGNTISVYTYNYADAHYAKVDAGKNFHRKSIYKVMVIRGNEVLLRLQKNPAGQCILRDELHTTIE